MAELPEGIAAPGVDFAALLDGQGERIVRGEFTYLDVREVDIVHVELLWFFEDTEVSLAPDEELPLVSILDQGG